MRMFFNAIFDFRPKDEAFVTVPNQDYFKGLFSIKQMETVRR